MTNEELKKRLKYISATPQKKIVKPRDELRRGVNKIESSSEYDIDEFDDFFEFEEDLSEMESARKQVERMESLKADEPSEEVSPNPEEGSGFITFDDESDGKSGDDSSFLMFGEYSDEEAVEKPPEEKLEEEVSSDTAKVSEEVNAEPNEEICEESKKISQEIARKNFMAESKIVNVTKGKFDFKHCVYIKDNEEQCKKQAPKHSDYCVTHRKVLGL